MAGLYFNTDECANYIPSNSSAVFLNHISSRHGSGIMEQIDTNGHVILVNPKGIISGNESGNDTGSILASRLSINRSNFMISAYNLYVTAHS